ncbi:MAG: DUF3465 domain-containing protein [Thiotrichales bacterium]|nr:DUF3465 domain-containing protein [Thiotrichales bacterium]
MKKILVLVVIAGMLLGVLGANSQLLPSFAKQNTAGDSVVERAFENRQSDVQVQGEGVVIKVLPDDNVGSRHQKFILKLPSGQTLLISHNIDLAPRLDSLSTGDTVEFYGEYEWNAKGGVVHWTHHDPRGKHLNGWLKHNGSTYQ